MRFRFEIDFDFENEIWDWGWGWELFNILTDISSITFWGVDKCFLICYSKYNS